MRERPSRCTARTCGSGFWPRPEPNLRERLLAATRIQLWERLPAANRSPLGGSRPAYSSPSWLAGLRATMVEEHPARGPPGAAGGAWCRVVARASCRVERRRTPKPARPDLSSPGMASEVKREQLPGSANRGLGLRIAAGSRSHKSRTVRGWKPLPHIRWPPAWRLPAGLVPLGSRCRGFATAGRRRRSRCGPAAT